MIREGFARRLRADCCLLILRLNHHYRRCFPFSTFRSKTRCGSPSMRRILDSVKRVLLRESQVQPVTVVFEDLHWIDGETQAFLDSLVESLPVTRLLLLANYRPEYQHVWGGKTYYRQLRIDPLPASNAEELLDELLGRGS